jgi:hypothetical protein
VTSEEEEAFVAGFSSPKDFDELALPFIFVEPPSLSSRVVNQWGWYTIYLLYSYKGTNTDASAAALRSCAAARV